MGVVVDTASIKNKFLKAIDNTNSGNDWEAGKEAVNQLMEFVRIRTPVSIQNAVVKYSRVKKGGIKTPLTIEISFNKNAIKRKSVNPSRYSHGVDNIVALLNNGYHAAHSISGYWHGNYIKTLKDRNGLHFMQKAISDFNRIYGSKHSCEAELSELYQ